MEKPQNEDSLQKMVNPRESSSQAEAGAAGAQTESVQVDHEEIRYHNLEIEKWTVQLNQVDTQRKLLNTEISKINKQYHEFWKYKGMEMVTKIVALRKQISEIEEAMLKVNEEKNNQIKEGK